METTPPYHSRIFNTIKYIDDHIEDDLSLDLLASKAHYSSYHFHRLFKAITNEPLNLFITRKRMEKSASMLIRNRKMPISEIAFACCFKDNSVFTKTFKKYYAMSPSFF